MARSTFYVALLVAAIVTTTVEQDDDPDEGVCDPGWKKYEKKCYFYNTHLATANCAESICERSGGHLASIETKGQEAEIMRLVNEDGCANGRFWIGYTDKVEEGKFIWSSSSETGSIRKFYPNEPNDYNRNEDCTEVIIKDAKWNDIDCGGPKRCYVCEKGLFKPQAFGF